MDSFGSIIYRMLYGKEFRQNTKKIIRDEVGDYTIDTCDTIDAGYETAIWKDNNPMIIVERYDTWENSKKGHKKWCKFCKNNPTSAYSVQTDEIEEF